MVTAQAPRSQPQTVQELLRETRALTSVIEEHSRQQKYHHQKIANAKRKRGEFVARLEAMGVNVIIEDTQPRRRHSDTSSPQSP